MQLRSMRYTRWIVGALTGAALMSGVACKDKITNSVIVIPSGISIVSGDAQTGTAGTTLANPLVVHVSDAAGNAVEGATVVWTPVTANDGALSASSTTTDVNGNTSVNWTLGTGTGTQAVTAKLSNGAFVTFHATSNAP